MKFDVPVFAKAWLAVALASSSDKELPTLHKTVAIEVYDNGVRLLATDRYLLLTAWVPDLDSPSDHEPLTEEAPARTVVVFDGDGRAKSLLNYALTLWRRKLDSAGVPVDGESIEIAIEFDQRMPLDEQTFAGMESRYAVLDVPDTERVWLEVVEAVYPDWRPLVREHTPETTKVIHLAPERLGRLGQVGKYVSGAIAWTFGGAERAALLRAGDPDLDGFEIEGVVMPVRWITEHDATDDGPAAEPVTA